MDKDLKAKVTGKANVYLEQLVGLIAGNPFDRIVPLARALGRFTASFRVAELGRPMSIASRSKTRQCIMAREA
jgi:hypothetical protein